MADTPDTTAPPTPAPPPPAAEPYPNIFFIEGKALGHPAHSDARAATGRQR